MRVRSEIKRIDTTIGELTVLRGARGDFFDLQRVAVKHGGRPLSPSEFGILDKRTLHKLAKNARRYTSSAIVVYPASHQVFTPDQAGVSDGPWAYTGRIPSEAIETPNTALLLVNPGYVYANATLNGRVAEFTNLGEPFVLRNFPQMSSQEGVFDNQTGMIEQLSPNGKDVALEDIPDRQRGTQCRVPGTDGFQFVRPVIVTVGYPRHKIDIGERQNVALGLALLSTG